MLVLGANLSKGPGAGSVPVATVLAVTIGRLIILPLVGSTLIVGSHRMGMLAGLNVTAIVVMMMMWAMPSALMIHSIATIIGNRPDEVATILFW